MIPLSPWVNYFSEGLVYIHLQTHTDAKEIETRDRKEEYALEQN